MTRKIPTEADDMIRECIEGCRSFAVIAGAGAGKTASLVDALAAVRVSAGPSLRRLGQKVACITYTKRAVEVIRSRLSHDPLFTITTLHGFIWGEISRFHDDIRCFLSDHRIPTLIKSAQEKDNGRASKEATRARARIAELTEQRDRLPHVKQFSYTDAKYGDYGLGELSHDDVVEAGAHFLNSNAVFQRLLGLRYPYIFVDEAQDTFGNIITGLNAVCSSDGPPMVGYFGDPWQQIYDGRAGMFAPPNHGMRITKPENFRCSPEVVSFLNRFRNDIQQKVPGDATSGRGSVEFVLIQAETPARPRNRYSEEQIQRALGCFDKVLAEWGWKDRDDVMRLFLARQMIARRLGFRDLHELFTGEFASSRSQEAYEDGDHFLLEPFVRFICPLVSAQRLGDSHAIMKLLRENIKSFDPEIEKPMQSLGSWVDKQRKQITELARICATGTTRDALEYCATNRIIQISKTLRFNLDRSPRKEKYNEEIHKEEKRDWLCDSFFAINAEQIEPYCHFINQNTAFSTQHGVKGEEYSKVVVVFDDTEAAWTNYNFSKLLTPNTAGQPTENQLERGKKLAYVCFSRASEDLRVLLFTANAIAARRELITSGLLDETQVRILCTE